MYGDYVEKYMADERIYVDIPFESIDYVKYENVVNEAFNENSVFNNVYMESNYLAKAYDQREGLSQKVSTVAENKYESYSFNGNNTYLYGNDCKYDNAFFNENNSVNNTEYFNSLKSLENIYSYNEDYISQSKSIYQPADYFYSYDNSTTVRSDSQVADYVNSSDITETVANSITDSVKNINISLGGITQNFSGADNAENIADSLCIYLKKALNGMAEGVYF